MSPNVLVTYATRLGSTEEVARVVTDVLHEAGVDVDAEPVAAVKSLQEYSAVVLCAPLYMGRLLKDARRFLARNAAALQQMPVILLVVGPVEAKEKDWTGARQQLDKELAKFPWLTPAEQHIVGGKFDPKKLGFPFKFILRKLPPSDARDWTAIREMARHIAAKFQPALQD